MKSSKPADPDIGVCWLVSMLHFYSGTLLQNLSGVDSTMRAKLVHGTNSMTWANSVLPTYMRTPRGSQPGESTRFLEIQVQVDTKI